MPKQNNRGHHRFKTRKENINNQSVQNPVQQPQVPPQNGERTNNNQFNQAPVAPNFQPDYQQRNQQPRTNNRTQPVPKQQFSQTTNPQKTNSNSNYRGNFSTQPRPAQTQTTIAVPQINPKQSNFKSNQKPAYPTNKQPQFTSPSDQQQNDLERNVKNKPIKFWKRPVVWIIIAIIAVAAIGLSLYLWLQPAKKATASHSPLKTEKITDSPDKALKSKKRQHPAKDVEKQQKSLQATQKAVQPKARDWKNSGSYDDMKYDSDDFTIQLNNSSDGVKLIPDSSNKPALFIEYTFTNKSKQPLKPSDIVSQDLQLKQNDQLLSAATPASDNHDAQDKLNAAQQEVAPGQKIDTAMMYAIGDTKSTISMYFMDLKTHQLLNTNQPFKL
ncbi:DUF5067 domain-containing protein [Bombilactobacillus bombi]|uniref:DUF5067 domain-containing protein n=1 Tax=Bombilactobacillus bombi TaxID=1303590 RepID=UPI000E56C70B|nr:DUF5067 domain-containing protein [Bombilactobacillus bombi]AXX64123.1 DUF5067 domain-containing protein [Bombilactobacillus bombi]